MASADPTTSSTGILHDPVKTRVIHAPPEQSSGTLSPELLAQVRGRVRLMTALFALAFGFDIVVYLVLGAILSRTGGRMPVDFVRTGGFQWVNGAAVLGAAVLWFASRSTRVSASRLHTFALVFEVEICFLISMVTYWSYYSAKGVLPNLTWVPAVVIVFPLMVPGPPRRMLAAAVASALTAPLSLFLLQSNHQISVPDWGTWFEQTFGPLAAAGFAWFAARMIHGLGKEVQAARDLGSYQLGELLGKGGMGEVYRATHRMLARPSAIKLIRPEMLATGAGEGAQMAVRRFHREATAAASLRSPHTVELYDFGATDDQTLYFVMELLEGMDLESLVRKKGPLPANRVIYILRQVCESLDEAHAAGLVHRDIKPANIHLGRLANSWDWAKVLDFGLVKSVAKSGTDSTIATAVGSVAGTPAYMPPEAARLEPLDGRADLYSLGCVAFFLLTGRLVFEAANSLELVALHMRQEPPAPSTLTEMPVPAELDRIILSCLAKWPADRPQTAMALSAALAAIPHQPWTQTDARRWWEVHRPS